MSKKLDEMTPDEIDAQLYRNALPILKDVYELVLGRKAGDTHAVDLALIMNWELRKRQDLGLPIAGRVEKPWGYYDDIHREKGCVLKRIVIRPGQAISYQAHQMRSEYWVVEKGTGQFQIGGQVFIQNEGATFEVKRHTLHRISNGGPGDLVILELQHGECSEDDITRVEDNYGRK